MKDLGPIGIFDSGYGGLTILKAIKKILPDYSFVYLGDNARAPYGIRSYETVLNYTLEAVNWLFNVKNCHLIILACNTASSKALRTIQQVFLPKIDPKRRVLGVIRPTVEVIINYTKSKHIGILGTPGTINSNTYLIEINKYYPDIKVFQQACPMWVPLIENAVYDTPGAEYFFKKDIKELLNKSELIDAILLGCTHYPIILNILKKIVKNNINFIVQDEIVANSLKKYLQKHPEINEKCLKNGNIEFFTTEDPTLFSEKSFIFFEEKIKCYKAFLFK